MRFHSFKTDNDKPSLSAIGMAGGFIRGLEHGYAHLFNNKNELLLAKHLFEAGLTSSSNGVQGLALSAMYKIPYFFQRSFFNLTCIKSYDELTVLRKLMIKEKIDKAIFHHAQQIVYLGGGYDIRSMVTAINNPNVTVYEIDHGPTRNFKIRGILSIPPHLGFTAIQEKKLLNDTRRFNHNLYLINYDLTDQDLIAELETYGYSSKKKTLFIAEGLTAYLSEDQNKQLLNQLSHRMNLQDELVISYLTHPIDYRILKKTIKNNNELHSFSLTKDMTIPFANDYHLDVVEQFDIAKHLGLIGLKEDQAYFINNEQQGRECYFTFKKQKNHQHQSISIDDVPQFALSLPSDARPRHTNACSVL